uniref:SAM domain-containing protein n=1 Tax=Romanomermis culicivorax TaxID=13658 RepID=A0A915IQ61_ROMCU
MTFVPAGSEIDLLVMKKLTDNTQVRPDNDFGDCLIANNRESLFNSTPLPSKRIQIRTTLAPLQRKVSRDNIQAAPAFVFERKPFAVENCIDKFLKMACCPEYIDIFRAQKIQINQLLRMTESDFEKLGIEKFGDRRRLMDFIKEFHRKTWSNMAMEPFSSVVEAVRLVSNLHAELSSMESSLMHFRRSIIDEPTNFFRGNGPNEKFNCEKLKSEMEFCQLAVKNLSDEFNRTFEFISSAISDYSIKEQTNAEINKEFCNVSIVITLSSAVVILAVFSV